MTIRTQLTVAIDDVCNKFSPIVCNFLDDRWLVVMALMEAPDMNDDELAAKVGLSQSQVKKIFREVGGKWRGKNGKLKFPVLSSE